MALRAACGYGATGRDRPFSLLFWHRSNAAVFPPKKKSNGRKPN